MTHDLTRTARYYDQRVASASDDRDAVGWRTSYAQDVNFLTLTRIDGLRDGARVLDVGCGLGALYAFFQRTGMRVDYTGIDISENMVANARKRHPGARFEVRDILQNAPRERYDVVICSGALSQRMPQHRVYANDMIATMYGLCDVALAFNMLSAYAFITHPSLQISAAEAVYEWPEQVLQFCKTQSQHVSLLHETDSGVFSVFVYRKNRGALERFLAYAKPGTTYDTTVRAVIDYHIDLGMWSELRTFLAGIKPCAAVSFFLGQANASLGDQAAAEAAFRAAIEADPAQPWPYIQLGYLFSRQGDLPRALAAANLAIEHAPREEEAFQALIKILFAHKQVAEARKAAAAMPDGPLADTLRATVAEDTTAALAAADHAIASASTFLPALVARAQLLERKGDTSAAIEAWRVAQRIAPVDASIALRIEALLRTQSKDLPK